MKSLTINRSINVCDFATGSIDRGVSVRLVEFRRRGKRVFPHRLHDTWRHLAVCMRRNHELDRD